MSPCGAEDHFLLWFSYIIIWTGSDSDCRSAAWDWMRGNPHRLNINWRANTCWKEKKTESHSSELHSFIFLSWDKICIKQALNLLCLSVWLLEQLTWLSGIQYMSQLVQHFYVSAHRDGSIVCLFLIILHVGVQSLIWQRGDLSVPPAGSLWHGLEILPDSSQYIQWKSQNFLIFERIIFLKFFLSTFVLFRHQNYSTASVNHSYYIIKHLSGTHISGLYLFVAVSFIYSLNIIY